MRKRNLNALIAACCFAALAPTVAQATDLVVDTNAEYSEGNYTSTTTNSNAILTIKQTTASQSFSGGTLKMNDTSQIQLTDAVGAVVFNSTTAAGSNNIYKYSGSTGTLNLGTTEVNAGKDLTVTSNAGNTTFGTTKVNANGELTVTSNAGNTTIGDTTLEGNTSGTTTLDLTNGSDSSDDNITVSSITLEAGTAAGGVVAGLTAEDANGGGLNVTTINQGANSKINLSGSGKIDIGTVNVTDLTNFNVIYGDNTTNTKIDNINVSSSGILGSNELANPIKTNNLNLAAGTTGITFDIADDGQTDTIERCTGDGVTVKIGGSEVTTPSIDISFNYTTPGAEPDQFVKYVKLIDSPYRILNSADGMQEIYTGGNLIYYTYDNDTPVGGGYYAPNTIRVTSYNLAEDEIIDYVTRQGTRTYGIGVPYTQEHYAGHEGVFAIPNMEANANVDNILTLHGTAHLVATDELETYNMQLFTVNSNDGIDRTMNLNGLVYEEALTQTGSTRLGNTGNGAVLQVITDNAAAGNATVNINSYTINTGTINEITRDPIFLNNTAQFNESDVTPTGNGGVIYSTGSKSSINAEASSSIGFLGNKASHHGGAIYNASGSTINVAASTQFAFNSAGYEKAVDGDTTTASGGAVYNEQAEVTLGGEDEIVWFQENHAANSGGAHYSLNNEFNVNGIATYINNVSGVQLTEAYDKTKADNYATTMTDGNGGAVAVVNNRTTGTADTPTQSTVTLGNGYQTFDGNSTSGKGGAVYLKGADTNNTAVINIAATRGNTEFTNNKQNVTSYTAKNSVYGGEAYLNADRTLSEHFDVAYVEYTPNNGESNAIYLDGNSTVNLSTEGNNKIIFNDKIASNGAYEEGTANWTNTINQQGNVYYNNDMSGYVGNFNLKSGTAYFTDSASVPFMGDYTLWGGSTLNLQNGKYDTISGELDLSNTTAKNPANMAIDLNLSDTSKVDKFNLIDPVTSGFINVTDINVKGTSEKEKLTYEIAKGATFTSDVKEVETVPASVYRYQVSGITGGLMLKKLGFDTSLYAPQVAVNARLAGQLDLYNDILHRVDEIAEYRYFYKKQKTNLYAADPDVKTDGRIDNGYTPYVNQQDGGCLWVKPNATIETISPSGQDGYKNRAYNAFIGYETPVANLKRGWELINTVFGGYQGAFQDFDNIYNYQNGGSGGYMANLFRNNFFAGGVVMMGGTNVQAKDSGSFNRNLEFGLFDIGGGVRAGYNVGLGKHWLFQPMLTASYIYISGINRHNERGEDVHLDGTSTVQIAPGFKIVGNYRGWQPYLLCDYTWPAIGTTRADVNENELDTLRLRSYLEYGVGFRKNIGERFSGYAQAVMRNGGRTGVSFQGGLVFKF